MNQHSKPILFAGEGHGGMAALRGLVEAGFSPDVCSDDTDVVALALSSGGRRISDMEAWEHIASGVILLAAYRPILKEEIIKKANIINIHYALLPRYRGLHATVWALLNGEPYAGFTLHEIDHFVDSGPVIWQERVPTASKTSWQLMLEMDDAVRAGVGAAVRDYIAGNRIAVPQNEEDAIFVTRRNVEDCRVDWNWSAEYFERILVALVPPYPRPFFDYKDRRIEIAKAQVVHRYYHEIPGHVVYRDAETVWIKLSDGLLKVWDFVVDGVEMPALELFKVTGARLNKNTKRS